MLLTYFSSSYLWEHNSSTIFLHLNFLFQHHHFCPAVISFSIPHIQLFLGQPLLLFPVQFQFRTCSARSFSHCLRVWPIHLHFHCLISDQFPIVLCQSSRFDIFFLHIYFKNFSVTLINKSFDLRQIFWTNFPYFWTV